MSEEKKDTDYYNADKRKEYNKKYYAEKKDIILKKITAKEQCQYCLKEVSHQNLLKHYSSRTCKKIRAQKDEINENDFNEKVKLIVEKILLKDKAIV